jgi:hypothetical protein
MGSSGQLFGVILTVVSTALGAGIGWGSMRAGLSELKDSVSSLKGLAAKVNVLEADGPKIWAVLDDHGKRIGYLEVDTANFTKSKPRRRK